MHGEAMAQAKRFAKKYLEGQTGRVLDVGAYNVNGSLKELFADWDYVGLDIRDGPGVDVVSAPPWPLDGNQFDLAVSNSTFEHDLAFWETFGEMVRVVRPRGLIYVCAPSTGKYHDYPRDCWRFLKDAWPALAEWAGVEMVEHWMVGSGWHDNCGVFRVPDGD